MKPPFQADQVGSLLRPPGLADAVGGCIFTPRCDFAEAACAQLRPELATVGRTHLARCLRWETVVATPMASSAPLRVRPPAATAPPAVAGTKASALWALLSWDVRLARGKVEHEAPATNGRR